MKPNNVMLLGFVNRAVEYLDEHMDEEPNTRLAELKNIDLASLKDELSDTLDTSLGTTQTNMATLLKAGNEAFDKFIEDQSGKMTITDEFDRLFDVDLDDKKDNQKELAKLLSFYNLEDDFEYDEQEESNDKDNASLNDTENNEVTDDFLQQIIDNVKEDDGVETKQTPMNIPSDKDIDNVFSEIIDNENKKTVEDANFKAKEKPVAKQETKEEKPAAKQDVPADDVKENHDEYLSSLITDLKKQLEQEESLKKEKEKKNKEMYANISKAYPYLPGSFIRIAYDLKEQFSKEYPNNKNVIVLHRVTFKNVDNLRKFVEIGLNHGYQINADENKMIVDIFKQFENSDGKILTNIYEIANQGYLLSGEYEGYRIMMNEEE